MIRTATKTFVLALFRSVTAVANGTAEYAEAFESTGKFVKKSTDAYITDLEDERAKRLAEMTNS